ncbi:MAG: hypothetical protein JSR82_08305 [Verrucomicrobia bacterium]|nr:hypothetical protein [Verrucomicrobiota bacterium]MBS0658232.1 hypothetical protein [Verrucomicrobiota bacterium]
MDYASADRLPEHPSDVDARMHRRLTAAVAALGLSLCALLPEVSGKMIGIALCGFGLWHYRRGRWYPIDLRREGGLLVLRTEAGCCERPVGELASVIEWRGAEGNVIDFVFHDGSSWTVPERLEMRPSLRGWVERSLAAVGRSELKIEERPLVLCAAWLQGPVEAIPSAGVSSQRAEA